MPLNNRFGLKVYKEPLRSAERFSFTKGYYLLKNYKEMILKSFWVNGFWGTKNNSSRDHCEVLFSVERENGWSFLQECLSIFVKYIQFWTVTYSISNADKL